MRYDTRGSTRINLTRADRDLIVKDWWSKGTAVQVANRHTSRLRHRGLFVSCMIVRREWKLAKARGELPPVERQGGGYDNGAELASAFAAGALHYPMQKEAM